MNALSLIVKFSFVTAALSFASGSIKDVLMGTFDSLSINAAHIQMGQLHGKLMEYYSAQKQYPQNRKELFDFLRNEFDAPLESVVLDPWKTSYYFLTNKFEILCYGPDRQRDTRDDIGYPYPEQIIKSWKFKRNSYY